MRRVGQFLSLLLILVAGVLWVSQASGAANDEKVRIKIGNKSYTVRLDTVTPDVGVDKSKKYHVNKASGGSYTVHVNDGWSLGSILASRGINYDDDFDYVEIPRDDGGSVRIYGSYLGPNRFDPSGPIALYHDNKSGQLTFIRAPYANVKNDINEYDNFPVDGTLSVKGLDGTIFNVNVTADTDKVKAEAPITFTADVKNGEGFSLSYHWTFSDGETSDEVSPSHTFDTKGTATASVVVTSDANGEDNVGEGAIALDVKKAAPVEDTSNTGTGGYSGYDPGYSGYSSGYTAPSYTDPGTDYGIPDVSTDPSTDSSTKPPKEADPTQTEPTGTTVSGELLQDAAVVPEGTASPSPESTTTPEPTTPVSTVESEQDTPTSVITGMAVAGLLGFGAFTELGTSGSGRSGRRRRLNPFARGNK